jgi:hypothetical protein
MLARMNRVIALARTLPHRPRLEALRIVIVCGCALALIAAGQTLPF